MQGFLIVDPDRDHNNISVLLAFLSSVHVAPVSRTICFTYSVSQPLVSPSQPKVSTEPVFDGHWPRFWVLPEALQLRLCGFEYFAELG